MKKIVISIVLILLLCGCWNYKELNDYAIITGIAIDKKDEKFEVSVLISNSSKSNGNSDSENTTQVIVYSGVGDTIFKAIKNIGLISSKELYLGHLSILVLSEDISKEGIYSVIDLLIRESSIKKNFYVTIARNSKAKDTLKIISPLTNFPSQGIANNLNSTTQLQGQISNINFNDLISKLINTGINPVINSIEIIGDEEKGSNKKNLETSEPSTYLRLNTLGIFKKDKLIKWADEDESIGINIINNKITELYFKTEIENGYVGFNTINFSSTVKIKLKNNKPIIDIIVKGDCKIVEVNGNIDLTDDKILKELNKKVNIQIKKYINKALKLAVENKTDVFGFGLRYHETYPKYYEQNKNKWEENLANIKVNIKSNVILKSKGSSEKSLKGRNNEK